MTRSKSDFVAMRLDATTQARLDALARQLSRVWHTATRSEVLRVLVLVGLQDAEKNRRSS
jgi:hypothetical protein